MVEKWGTFCLIVMTLPIMGHVVILPLMLDVAGRDGWISVLAAMPLGILFAYAIYRLRLKYPVPDFIAAFGRSAGKWVSLPLKALLAVYMYLLCIVSLAALIDMIHIGFLPATPIWILVAWFAVFCLYAALKGIRAIALTAGILTILSMLTGHSVTLMANPNKEAGNLLPVLEFGLSAPLWGVAVLCSIWTELLFLLLVPINNIKEKRLFLLWTIGVLLNGLMMASTLTGSVLLFGMGQADEFMYPALEEVRIISLGFIDRFDIYGMMLMSYGCYIRTSLFLRLGYNLIFPSRIHSSFWGKALLVLFGAGAAALASFLANDHFKMMEMTMAYAWLVVLYPLPFVLLMLPNRKKERRLTV